MQPILEVKNLKKYFKTNKGMLHAVDNVSFSIEKGKTLGIVGESGCGKSTLGRTVLHLLQPDGGLMYFEGQDISSPKKKDLLELRSKMQMIFQDPYSSIDPRMNVRQIIEEPLVVNRRVPKKDRTEKILNTMDFVGIPKRLLNAYPHELDGGRRQRVGIARALIMNPSFIVCDEPVSALDVSIQAQILNLMQDLQEERNLTYIFITHDLSVVRHISDDIGVMYLGVMVEKSASKELFKKPLHPYTQALLSAIPVPKIHNRRERIILRGEITSPIEPEKRCRFANRCNYVKDICLHSEPELREIEPQHFCACHFAEDFL